jgi:hypothetical protein
MDTVDTLYSATEAAWEWVAPHMELLGFGAGAGPSSVLEDQLLGIYSGTVAQISSARPSPYGGGYGGGGGGYDDLPLGLWRIWRL